MLILLTVVEDTSSVANKLDVLASKRLKAVDNTVDIDSEDEFLEFVDSELPGHHQKEKDLVCSKLAQKIETYWKNPSASSVAKVFKQHK